MINIILLQCCKKKRKYNDSYVEYGFTYINNAGEEKSQCVICYKDLSNNSMKPSKLKPHLQTRHSKYSQKDRTFFQRYRSSLKIMKLDSDGRVHETNAKILNVSFAVSFAIAKEKKLHTIGETLIKPCAKKWMKLYLEKRPN